MFWTKVEKERLKRAYRARMSQAISGLEAMDISGLSQVYCAVATEDRELIRSGGRAIGMVMEGMTMRQVIRLSEHFRQYTSMEWDIDSGQLPSQWLLPPGLSGGDGWLSWRAPLSCAPP